MFITAEFVFINPELNEIESIIKNTQLKYMQKYRSTINHPFF